MKSNIKLALKLLNTEKAQEHFKRVVKRVYNLGGGVDYYGSGNLVSVHLEPDCTDENSVASIDWGLDSRYNNQRTFNVETYNEDFKLTKDELKKKKRLQVLAVKLGAKLFKDENI